MEILKTKGILVAVIIIVLTGSSFAYTKQYYSAPKQEDVSKAEQLTQITRLDVDTILRLYKAAGDWDKVIKNIAVYQQILTLVEGIPAEKQFFNLIQKYEAADLFVAYDYFTANRLPFNRITEVLDQRLQGGDWDNILANCGIDPEYKNYRVLDKEDLRQLLDKGCLPDDILKADNIARANDLTLQYVLGLKTADNIWDNKSIRQPDGNPLSYRCQDSIQLYPRAKKPGYNGQHGIFQGKRAF